MIRMIRDGEVLRCSGALEAVLPNTADGWGQLSRVARERHLMPPEVDKPTGEFRYLPARRPQDADAAWAMCVHTQRKELEGALHRVERAKVALTRLGEFVEGVVLPSEPPTAAPSTPPPSPPPAAESPRLPAPPTIPPEPEPVAAPVAPAPASSSALVTDAQAIAISVVAAQARESRPVQWYKLGVCVLVLEGRAAALALEKLPAKVAGQLKSLSESRAREQALAWAAEAAR